MGKTIMTVDDAATMRKMISFTLKSVGHEVVEASDGTDALAQLQGGRTVDLIITDVNMPTMDGITLTRHARQLNHCKAIPILVLTTESEPAKKAEAKSAGATGWITKPFSQDQLLAVIAKVLP